VGINEKIKQKISNHSSSGSYAYSSSFFGGGSFPCGSG